MSDIDTIVRLAKRRGFVFPGSEIYGGLANTWDYGPLGVQMRKNIKDSWWRTFVESRPDMVGMDGAIFMNSNVWKASGHEATFNDPLVEDTVTHKRYRADHLIEEATGADASGMSLSEMEEVIRSKGITSPDNNPLTPPRLFNLMFSTEIGSTQDTARDVYLRPETAQSMFVNFKNVVNTCRMRVPFGIAQIGKAFRNEITPGNFIFRTLEFEQMEIEYFAEEGEWEEVFNAWLSRMEAWGESIGLDMSKVHRLDVPKEELAHYSKRTIDMEFDFPFGTKELWGLAYRGDFDLSNHQQHSGQSLAYTDPADQSRTFIPHVIEPTFGVDRTMLALLVSAYHEEEVEGETRVVMKFAPRIAPYHVAVLPLMRKDQLVNVSQSVYETLSSSFRCDFDVTQSIGKRYRRQDEIGTPWCVTIDFDTLEDEAVTVRDRDTMQQERIPIRNLEAHISSQLT